MIKPSPLIVPRSLERPVLRLVANHERLNGRTNSSPSARRAAASVRACAHLEAAPYKPGFVGKWVDTDAAILLGLSWRTVRAAEARGMRGAARFAPSQRWTAWLNG
jgi:hypothetical protein